MILCHVVLAHARDHHNSTAPSCDPPCHVSFATISGEDFGQKIDLTVRIREILRNYPEGTSILKELVQNADDAGAREVRLCLDLRQHGTGSLPNEALAQFQGPALLVFNDGVFTETDFRCLWIAPTD